MAIVSFRKTRVNPARTDEGELSLYGAAPSKMSDGSDYLVDVVGTFLFACRVWRWTVWRLAGSLFWVRRGVMRASF